MELRELIDSLAKFDEMESEDGLNTIKVDENAEKKDIKENLNESSKNRVKVNVFYDGKEIDGFEFSYDLPEDYDLNKITTEIEVI